MAAFAPIFGPMADVVIGEVHYDAERRVAALPSQDVLLRASGNETHMDIIAKILRREGYSRAILIQSRGQVQVRCVNRCARHERLELKFRECRTVNGFMGGACGECV
ncbi:hypothetical protein F5883DRAFT_687911 [Diaporthe sp. PMI_573]|nr:hypothetical protein F5883DRAFT_695026 [Diaporthaceae sp. PMI_573]KAH8754542.1 hypothetical protein F5883DRAFT_687911 [Diaporthaceae sp. PMI_573]